MTDDVRLTTHDVRRSTNRLSYHHHTSVVLYSVIIHTASHVRRASSSPVLTSDTAAMDQAPAVSQGNAAFDLETRVQNNLHRLGPEAAAKDACERINAMQNAASRVVDSR